ncbi:MAG TPA: hypothetical protein PKC27_08965, partial [Methanomethylovorans sp.]|nr:hypothetical protein [Methanomethylovorans sp.]
MRTKLSGLIYSVVGLIYAGIILLFVAISTEAALMDNVTVDKSELLSAIDDASIKLESAVAGVELGQYPQSAINAFDSAIDKAEAVVEDASASQVEVDQTLSDLKAAEARFDAAKITVVDHTPPSTVSSLRETGTGTNWIRWSWKNPSDPDFSHLMV